MTKDAELCFIHNRADETTVTVRKIKDCTIFAMDGAESDVRSEGEFRLTLPEKSALMLVRQKTEGTNEVR